MQQSNQIVKNILQRDGLYIEREPIHGTTDSGNYLPAMRKSQKTILDWYSSLVVSLSIER